MVLEAIVRGELSVPYTTRITERYRSLTQRLEPLRMRAGREILDAIFPPGQVWAEPLRAVAEDSIEEWTAENILDTLRTNITQPELPSNVGYIRIMSLHKSKGLNADHVVVTGLIEGLIPSRDDDLPFEVQMRHVEEQRRLFYVAITRPKKTLVLSSVLSLPRNLAHNMGAFVQGGDQFTAGTIASTFLSQLGPNCPRPVLHSDWIY
jgi:superfamily I DNA/RNA helicase